MRIRSFTPPSLHGALCSVFRPVARCQMSHEFLAILIHVLPVVILFIVRFREVLSDSEGYFVPLGTEEGRR